MRLRFPRGRLDIGRLSILALLAVSALAFVTRSQWDWLLESGEAETQNVDAPMIDLIDEAAGERLYRVAPNNGSEVRYVVTERLAGSEKVTVGTTAVVGGDIVVNTNNPAATRLGTIVVNVEMFRSDSALRDKRLRHDFLESNHWPFATFDVDEIAGLPASIVDGGTHQLALTGQLTVKETSATVVFLGPVTIDETEIRASVEAVVLGSTFDVGPINIARLAHTDDEITLQFDLVAERVTAAQSSPSLETDLPADEIAAGEFEATVQPILETRCVSCHTSGGPGWSTLALDTAQDAALLADDIALVTAAGYMPPWLPSDSSPAFHGDWSLNDDELATIAAWAAEGGGLDVDSDTRLIARTVLIDPIERDQVVAPAEAYVGSIDRPDDYRCQIHRVDDAEGDGTWLTGFSFEPDQQSIVHHAIVYRVPAAALDEAEALDGSDGRPGWTCYGRSGLRSSGIYSIAGWAPGQVPAIYPDGVGLYLEPGDFIVNQIHYHYDHDTPADRSLVVLDVATDQEVAAGLTRIQGSSYLTPAEMPCLPEEDGPLCDRDAVLRDIAEKYGRQASFIPDSVIDQCAGTVDDYDDLDGSVAHSSCDLPAENSGTIFSVLGHMHEFGAAYRMTLHPDTADERVLLDIPVWSFEWQLAYEPVDDIRIDRGDVVRFECWWDRSLVFLEEPRYVTWNEGTVDEMCFSSIRVVPD